MNNPMQDYQRNQLLAQQAIIQRQLAQLNYPSGLGQFAPYPQPPQPQFYVRQVGNIDEAKSFPVDPAAIYIFLDTGTGQIYLKRLNTENGKSEFFRYSIQEETQASTKKSDISLEERLTKIENRLEAIDAKPVSSNANDAESRKHDPASNTGKFQKAKSADVQSDPELGCWEK